MPWLRVALTSSTANDLSSRAASAMPGVDGPPIRVLQRRSVRAMESMVLVMQQPAGPLGEDDVVLWRVKKAPAPTGGAGELHETGQHATVGQPSRPSFWKNEQEASQPRL